LRPDDLGEEWRSAKCCKGRQEEDGGVLVEGESEIET